MGGLCEPAVSPRAPTRGRSARWRPRLAACFSRPPIPRATPHGALPGGGTSPRFPVKDGMDTAALDQRFLDADAFLRTDQASFGTAWRYELVRGVIVAHAAPSREHAIMLSNLAGELYNRLRGHPECGPEIGSGAVPQSRQRDTARIPDATIRCGKHPRVLFEVISPSELTHKRQWDQKRSDLQAVEGVTDIVEIFQDEMLAHVWRRQGPDWVFASIAEPGGQIVLPSVGISIPLAALYERVEPEGT